MHLCDLESYIGICKEYEKQAILEIRTHALWYIKGLKGSAPIKAKICQCKSTEELFEILDAYLKSYEE